MYCLQFFIKNILLCICLFFVNTNKASAWGPEGHAIVGRLAMQFVSNDVRTNVLAILGNMPIDTQPFSGIIINVLVLVPPEPLQIARYCG